MRLRDCTIFCEYCIYSKGFAKFMIQIALFKKTSLVVNTICSKTCVKQPLKNRQNKDLNDKWKLNEGGKYCRMLPLEHSAILLTCIKR